MARIAAVPPGEAHPLIKLSYWYAKRRFGEVPEPFAVTANHRKLFVASAIHELVAEKASTMLPANTSRPRCVPDSLDSRLLVVRGFRHHAAQAEGPGCRPAEGDR
jgi:hypothetical protein